MPQEHSLNHEESFRPQPVALDKQLRDLASLLHTAKHQEWHSRSPEWNQQMDRLLDEISQALSSIQPHQPYRGRSIEELKTDAENLLLPLS